jgi:hypothetical protein
MSRGFTTASIRQILSHFFCVLSLVVGGTSGAVAAPSNAGTDFILAALPNINAPIIELHITAPEHTTVQIAYPVNAPTFESSADVGPEGITVVTLPVASAQDWLSGQVQSNAVHLTSAKPFVGYLVNRATFSSDAGMMLPTNALGTDYIITDYTEAVSGSQFIVTAVFDDTLVTITPTSPLQSGQSAGIAFQVLLDRGQSFYARGLQNATLSGTSVTAQKIVAVTNGNFCAQVPLGTQFCNSIFEFAHPTSFWGNSFFGVNVPNRPQGTAYRLYAAQNGTVIIRNGLPGAPMTRGQYVEFGPTPDTQIITANHPIFGVQFITGLTSPGATSGDPAMTNLIPTEQYLNQYRFATVGGTQFEEHFLTLIVQTSDVGNTTLDGQVIAPALFTAINSEFSFAVLPLPVGSHLTSSPAPHGITVGGFNTADSYIYPGGARAIPTSGIIDTTPPVCSLSGSAGLATELAPSEDNNNNGILDAGEDLNGNNLIDEDLGLALLVLNPSAENFSLNFSPFSQGATSLPFELAVTQPGLSASAEILAYDQAGNSCLIPVSLTANCSGLSIQSELFEMDGSTLVQRSYALKALQSLKNLGVSKAQRKVIHKAADALYIAGWSATWSISVLQLSCDPNAYCSVVSNTGSIENFTKAAEGLHALTVKTLDKVKKLKGKLTPKLKLLQFQSKSELEKNLALAEQIPPTTSQCDPGVTVNVQ